MRIGALADKLLAILRRDLTTAIRYRSGFLINAIGALTELAAFYFLARAVGPGFRPDGVDYFLFLLVGTGFYTFLVMGIHSLLQSIQDAQRSGTLEVLLTTSTPASTLLSLSAVSAFSTSAIQFSFYVGVGLFLFRGSFAVPNLAGCCIVFLLSVVIAAALGIFAAALQVSIHKGSVVLWLLGSGAWFMTGTLFPVSTLPKPLRLISALIPITHCLDGMRQALLQGTDLTALSREVATLALFAFTLLPASLLLFSHCLKSARQNGTLAYF